MDTSDNKTLQRIRTNTALWHGLANGTLERYGSTIREKESQKCLYFIVETGSVIDTSKNEDGTPVLGAVEAINNTHGLYSAYNDVKDILKKTSPEKSKILTSDISKSIGALSPTYSALLHASQISAAASVLTLGVSVAGFAYMSHKLNKLDKKIDETQAILKTGFSEVNTKLDKISGQLTYLHLFIESKFGQVETSVEEVSKALDNIQARLLKQPVSLLRSELNLISIRGIPNDAITIDRILNNIERAKIDFADEVWSISQQLEMARVNNLNLHDCLIHDVFIQWWAVALSAEAQVFIESRDFTSACRLLDLELPRFEAVVCKWADHLLYDEESPELSSAFRFLDERFSNHISKERVYRIIRISKYDSILQEDEAYHKECSIKTELQMQRHQGKGREWLLKEIAIAEYLDGLSELLARLDSLRAFAQVCNKKNLSNIQELIPEDVAINELLLLPFSI